MPNREIAKKVGVSEKCVRTMKIKYVATNTVSDLPRSGRLWKLRNRDVSYIYNQLRVNMRLSNPYLAELFNEKVHAVGETALRL